LANCEAKLVVRETVSKPAILLVLGVVVLALAVVFGVFAHDDEGGKHLAPTPHDTEESIREPTPSAPTAVITEPLSAWPALVPKVAPELQTPEVLPAQARLDEATMVARLHELAASDPPQSLKLAREALARFPDSPRAPEFEWNVVKALANMDRYREAEEEARGMLEKYPDSPLSVDVDRHLLHRPPNPSRVQ